MKFRTAFLLGALTLILGLVGITSAVAVRVVEHDARSVLDTELTRGALVLEELFDHRQSLYEANAMVVAEEPRLRAVVATESIDHATVLDVATELRRAVGSNLLLLTDASGVLVADTAAPRAVGFTMSDKPAIASALARGTGRGLWTAEGRVYQVVAQRLAFGDTVVGVLVVGWELDDALADTAARQTGGAVVLLAEGRPIASSLPPGTMGSVPTSESGPGSGPGHVFSSPTVDGTPHRAITGTLGDDPRIRYLVLRPLDEALATSHRLVRRIYGVGGAAALAAILLVLGLAQRLSRPLRGLVEFTREIAAGRHEPRPAPRGPTELRTLGEAMNRMAAELAASREQLAAKERLEREVEIANRIQTSILPVDPSIPGYSIAASMQTASEVGGDYYDVIPTPRGGWIGIGDVAGHGLPAGVVMLMTQSATSVLVRTAPHELPSVLLTRLNEFLFDNLHTRLEQDEYVTFTLLRCSIDGEVVYAGAHEEIVIWREATGECTRLHTPGPWLNVLPDVGHAVSDQTCRLEPGDLMLLYTDGVTEAMDGAHEQFGMDRLCALVQDHARRPLAQIVKLVREQVEVWSAERVDDVTLLAIRYDGPDALAPAARDEPDAVTPTAEDRPG